MPIFNIYPLFFCPVIVHSFKLLISIDFPWYVIRLNLNKYSIIVDQLKRVIKHRFSNQSTWICHIVIFQILCSEQMCRNFAKIIHCNYRISVCNNFWFATIFALKLMIVSWFNVCSMVLIKVSYLIIYKNWFIHIIVNLKFYCTCLRFVPFRIISISLIIIPFTYFHNFLCER